MCEHIKDCELGDNWKDCPACVRDWNSTCAPKEILPVPEPPEDEDPTRPRIIRKRMVLTQDVKNPHPDRRYKYDWQCFPVWKEGTRFIFEEMDMADYFHDETLRGKKIQFLAAATSTGHQATHKSGAFQLVYPHLVEEEPSVKGVLTETGMDSYSYRAVNIKVIEFLVSNKYITLDQFRYACEHCFDDEDD